MSLGAALYWIATLAETSWAIDGDVVRFGKNIQGLKPFEGPDGHNAARHEEMLKIINEKKVSFYFSGTGLSKVLSFLADMTGMDYVFPIEMPLTKVPIKQSPIGRRIGENTRAIVG